MTSIPGARLFDARPTPVERFLGAEEARGGPFALLGVSAHQCTDDVVLAALDRQLERVSRHPECDTPEADEVRLGLHAAAAQLLDPSVRRHLVARWTGAPISPAPRPPPPSGRSRSHLLLEHDALLTLGLYGGWNQLALRRLVALAHARGLTADQVAATLRGLAVRRRRPGAVSARPRAVGNGEVTQRATKRPVAPEAISSVPLPEQIDPARRLLVMILVFGGTGLLLAAGAIILIIRLLTAEPVAVPAPGPAGAVSTAPGLTSPATVPIPSASGASVPPTGAPQPAAPRASRDGSGASPGALVRELVACSQGLGIDPEEAMERFGRAVEALGQAWPRLARDQLVATQDSIVEFVYRTGDVPEMSARALESVAKGAAALIRSGNEPLAASEVVPAVWSMGILVRLSREKDLTASAREAIDGWLASALGHARFVQERTFEAGAAAAIGIVPRRLLPVEPSGADPPAPVLDAWRKWAEAARAAAGTDDAQYQLHLLNGLEILLLLGPDPTADQRVYETVSEMTSRLTWRSGDPSRPRLIRWFDDRRLSAGDLHAVTSSLASRSAAEGVDITMVLSAGASDRVRADLRDRFARSWGVATGIDREALDARWAQTARDAVNRSYGAAGPTEHLASAVVLARVNEAAWRLLQGDAEGASAILADLTADVDAVLAGAAEPAGAVAPIRSGDAAWAEKYLAARRNIPVRMELLNRLTSQGTSIGPIDAEVLVQEALVGTPAEVRIRAGEVARQFADSAALVNAVLEQLHRAPRIPLTASFVQYVAQSRMPPVGHSSWAAAARRALVERVLELVSAQGSLSAIDRLSVPLTRAYRGLASETALTPEMRRERVQPPAHASAAAAWQRWRTAAEKLVPAQGVVPSLEQLDRRRSGRAALASGLVQAFAAEQASLFEIMAYVAASEVPHRADELRTILAEQAQRRREARTIMEQIGAVERAITQLWLLRAQSENAS